MDAKVIILLVFILFGMIVAYMVANGMVDLTSIFSRVTKSQAQESLGGVKLEVVSPVPGVYYDANVDDAGNGYMDIAPLIKISGKNLDGKALTVSVASPNWYLSESIDNTDNSPGSGNGVPDNVLNGITTKKTIQKTFGTDLTVSDNIWTMSGNLYIVRDASSEPFNMPEFVELIFAVGETAKAEVTIVAEP